MDMSYSHRVPCCVAPKEIPRIDSTKPGCKSEFFLKNHAGFVKVKNVKEHVTKKN